MVPLMNINTDMERFKEFQLEKKFVKSKDETKKFFENILMPHICAFLNVTDNKRSYVQIKIEDGVLLKEVAGFKQKIEKCIENSFGIPLFYESIKVEDASTWFRLIVTSLPELSSFKYNLYLHACNESVANLSSLSIDIILQIINGLNKSQTPRLVEVTELFFAYDDTFPSSESNKIQFKHFPAEKKTGNEQNDPSGWLYRKIKLTLSHYVSAFANDEGGRIYYGIEDKERKIKGQTLKEEHQEDVRAKINNILIGKAYQKEHEKMQWGSNTQDNLEKWDKNPKDKPWNIQFIPVYEKELPKHDTFVIVITVHHFPYGVFSKSPQSYQWDEEKTEPVLIEYTEWRKQMEISYNCKNYQINPKERMDSLKTINSMEKLVDSGETTEEVMRTLSEESTPAITLWLERAFCHYRSGDSKQRSDVEKCLAEAKKILYSEDPPVNRFVHELHYCSLKASFERSLGKLQESLLTTYECLEKTKRVIPGWEAAIVWNTHGNNLAAVACGETSGYKRNERFDDAVRAWCQAIYHAGRAMRHAPKDKKYEDSLVNIIHMSQLYIALLHFGFTPSGEEVKVPPRFTEEEIKDKVENRIAAVPIGCIPSEYNNCLRLIVDFLVEQNDEKENHIREAAAQIPRIKPLATKVLKRFNPTLSFFERYCTIV